MFVRLLYKMTRKLISLPSTLLRSDAAKDAELLVLRHENAVLRRQLTRPVSYDPADRFWFATLSGLIPRLRWLEVLPVTPSTPLGRHRRFIAAKWDYSAPPHRSTAHRHGDQVLHHGRPLRSSTRYERARVANLALQNAISAARTAPAPEQDEAPAAPASTTANTVHHDDQAAATPHAVDHHDRAAALTPAQQAAAVHAHQQATMPELLEGRATDPATWLRTPENLNRLAVLPTASPAACRH
jgi:hypothetical protein